MVQWTAIRFQEYTTYGVFPHPDEAVAEEYGACRPEGSKKVQVETQAQDARSTL